MTAHKLVDRGFQGVDPQITAKANIPADQIGQTTGLHLIQKPEPLLRKCSWNPLLTTQTLRLVKKFDRGTHALTLRNRRGISQEGKDATEARESRL